METHVEWTTPSPLWPLSGDPNDVQLRRAFRRPEIFRFASDDFMEDLMNLMQFEPARLDEYIAAPETWTSPPTEPEPAEPVRGLALSLTRLRAAAVRRLELSGVGVPSQSGASGSLTQSEVLKLFHPAHGRFYLIGACLVCRVLGLPDRRVDTTVEEKTTWVLRLLQPGAAEDSKNPDPEASVELALVGGTWKAVTDARSLMPGEMQYPLSPVNFVAEDNRRRRVFVGLVPVGQREQLLGAPRPKAASQPDPPPLLDTRQALLKAKVLCPWHAVEELAAAALKTMTEFDSEGDAPSDTQRVAIQNRVQSRTHNQIQVASWYILLEFARWLKVYLPDLWTELPAGTGGNLPEAQRTVLSRLKTTTFGSATLASALTQAMGEANKLDSVKVAYDPVSTASAWPSFLFRFHSVSPAGVTGLTPPIDRKTFEGQIVQALNTADPKPAPPARIAAQARANPAGPAWFTIRCVFELSNCTAFSPPVVSDPTRAFQMAAFFDPDAPARPIRIGMPVDTTPSGLSKFDKNTAFVMSDVLCGQAKRAGGMSFGDLVRSVLPFPLNKDLSGGAGSCTEGGLEAGMVCSFSIPIITICALILLLIFVKLLDIIFFWMPFFQICLPLPRFSGKES